jgi:predicted GNAT family acetyltransferase/arsenate reductase-like glutaredoxin family protein
MQISKNEILFIYNSNDLQDRQALGYARSLPNHKIKEVDLQKDSFSETQIKQIADMLEIEPVSLVNSKSDIYKRTYSDVELTGSGALKAMASKPELMKTPIALYNDQAVPIDSPYQLIKQDLNKLVSIQDYTSPPNGANIRHNQEQQMFYADLGHEIMTLEYSTASDVIDFTSTYVPSKYRNRGLGHKLVNVGLKYAADNNLKVKASCPFVEEVVKQHPKYQHLILK